MKTLPLLRLFWRDWFADFRWREFASAVAAAYGVGYWLGLQLHLSEHNAQIVADFGAAIGAIAYVRNPKARDWKDGTNASEQIPGS